jgi:cephalosporin hydroxylase
MNLNKSLKECFQKKLRGSCDKKPVNYFDVYESHLEHLRNDQINLLEIGVRWGGSVWGWRNYFQNASIIGLDIDPNSMQYGTDNEKTGVKLYLGDQCDSHLLNVINTNHGPFDIIIDDGGHTMDQQLQTFETLWPLLKNGGIYVIEDVHTSYWPSFGGGYKKSSTFIEFVKTLIDNIHAYYHKVHTRSADHKNLDPINYLDRSVYGLHIYDAIVFIQKLERDELMPIQEVNL